MALQPNYSHAVRPCGTGAHIDVDTPYIDDDDEEEDGQCDESTVNDKDVYRPTADEFLLLEIADDCNNVVPELSALQEWLEDNCVLLRDMFYELRHTFVDFPVFDRGTFSDFCFVVSRFSSCASLSKQSLNAMFQTLRLKRAYCIDGNASNLPKSSRRRRRRR